jgi:hypothetical protein
MWFLHLGLAEPWAVFFITHPAYGFVFSATENRQMQHKGERGGSPSQTLHDSGRRQTSLLDPPPTPTPPPCVLRLSTRNFQTCLSVGPQTTGHFRLPSQDSVTIFSPQRPWGPSQRDSESLGRQVPPTEATFVHYKQDFRRDKDQGFPAGPGKHLSQPLKANRMLGVAGLGRSTGG